MSINFIIMNTFMYPNLHSCTTSSTHIFIIYPKQPIHCFGCNIFPLPKLKHGFIQQNFESSL